MTNAAWPRAPSSGSTEHTTTWTLAMPPLVAHAFWPLMTHSSEASSYFARVRSEETSEPASGSEKQNAPSLGSSAVPKHCGTHSPSCSGVPEEKMPATASEVPMIDMPMPASPQKSSSLTIGSVRPVGSEKNWAIASKPYRPILAASWMIGHGVSSRSSHSEAAGRTTFSANPWTHSRMSFWSCESAIVNGVSWVGSTVAAGISVSAAAMRFLLLVRVVSSTNVTPNGVTSNHRLRADHRRAGPRDRHDGPQHPLARDARPAPAARGAGADRLLRPRAHRSPAADPRAADQWLQPRRDQASAQPRGRLG